VLFISLNFGGCSNSSQTVSKSLEDSFQANFPVVDMNKTFQVKVNDDQALFEQNSEILLTFNNLSPDTLDFPTDPFIKLFVIEDGNWVEIKNKFTYSGSLELAPQGTILLDTSEVTIKPELDDQMKEVQKNGSTLVRVLMIGEIIQNNAHTGKFVGAYTDIFLKP
jgi:hypothetical protein